MPEYIERDNPIRKFKDYILDCKNEGDELSALVFEACVSILMDIPSADVVPVERLKTVEAERDAAIEQLHGYCAACNHYTGYHGKGVCANCIHEYWKFRSPNATSQWEWRGVRTDNEG